ncbi:hypothetical protein LSTR_LSTR015580 [Laodelphax striatellus]|uniref:Uncharacterized protein n=1 Tax=Laodelphax striatellus TaxID=195883 RepID=A0A482WV80_LAOST|nr:hypothetical protein LSTR_LSTR015580 [Laodelphax striatellus]
MARLLIIWLVLSRLLLSGDTLRLKSSGVNFLFDDFNLVTEAMLPRFAEPIPNVTVTVGRDALLACVVDNLRSYKSSFARAAVNSHLARAHKGERLRKGGGGGGGFSPLHYGDTSLTHEEVWGEFRLCELWRGVSDSACLTRQRVCVRPQAGCAGKV